MGRTEYVNAYLGIKISLESLISQINESNYILIKDMLKDGYIEDSYGNFNRTYKIIISDNNYQNIIINKEVERMKEYLTKEFMHGMSTESGYHGTTQINIYDGSLIEQYLLVPIKQLLTNQRYGYDIYETNGISRQIDFDLSVNVEKYKEINNFEIVFMLKQVSM
jgi:hypothetical protein